MRILKADECRRMPWRTIAVLLGDGLELSVAGTAPVELTRDSDPLAFPGDVTADANLLGGTVTDLNVMIHRDRLKHSVRRVSIGGSVELALEAPLALLVCAQAAVHVELNAQTPGLRRWIRFFLKRRRPHCGSLATHWRWPT